MSLVIDGDSAINITEVGGLPRIIGDFSNATYTSRALFQSSTINGQTSIGAVPNGTSSSSSFIATGSSDPTNTSYAGLLNVGTEARVASGILGSGTYLPMTFYNGGSERMRITTDGNVGIGATPLNKLHISGSVSLQQAYQTYLVNSYYDGAWKYLENGMAWGIGNNFGGPTNSLCFATAAVNSSGSGAALTWAPRMSIDSNGRVLIGTTVNSDGNQVVIRGGDGTQLGLDNAGTTYTQLTFYNNGNRKVRQFFDNTLTRFYIDCNNAGGVYLGSGATSWTAASDERIKDIIEPISDAVNKVTSLRAIIGKYKTDADGIRRAFLIAQDVQAVLPEAVDSSDPELLGVAYSDVIPLLVAAIQELKAELDNAKERIAVLENK